MAVYAYVGTSVDDALVVVDVTTPTAPVLKGEVHGAGADNYLNGAYGVFVKGNYAFVACTAEDSLTIIDISNPASPTFKGKISGAGDPNYLNFPWDVFVKDSYAYVVSQIDNSLSIFDVSNPTTPTLAAVLRGSGSPNYLGEAIRVWVEGNYAYVLAASDECLTVIDVSDPTAPTYVTRVTGIDASGAYTGGGLFILGDYAYVAGCDDYTFRIIDISTPASASQVGSLQDYSNLDRPFAIVVSGNYAYVACYNEMAILDISDKTDPTFVSLYYGYTNQRNIAKYGDYIYLTSISSDKLEIVDVSDVNNPAEAAVFSGNSSPNYMNGAMGLAIRAGEMTYPTDAISRVTNLIHRYNRNTGVYTLEMALGEVTTDFGLPEWLTMPQPAVPEVPVAKPAEPAVSPVTGVPLPTQWPPAPGEEPGPIACPYCGVVVPYGELAAHIRTHFGKGGRS